MAGGGWGVVQLEAVDRAQVRDGGGPEQGLSLKAVDRAQVRGGGGPERGLGSD